VADVELTIEDGIATVVLNRPDTLNALCTPLLDAIDRALAEIEATRGVRAVLITGAGRAFCAGADIEEISRLDASTGYTFARRGQAVFSRVENLSVPVVAAVNGFALGGGCELAMSCHVRVASNRARFGQPEVKLGILPGFGGTQRLPRIVGRSIATELILSGRYLKAEEALQIGLVNEVVEPDALLPRCREILSATFPNGPGAIALSLQAIREGLDLDLDAALEREAELFAQACGTPEKNEGTRAFLEKREPKF
jgi:enoyl-CoA hydratase